MRVIVEVAWKRIYWLMCCGQPRVWHELRCYWNPPSLCLEKNFRPTHPHKSTNINNLIEGWVDQDKLESAVNLGELVSPFSSATLTLRPSASSLFPIIRGWQQPSKRKEFNSKRALIGCLYWSWSLQIVQKWTVTVISMSTLPCYSPDAHRSSSIRI